jgi:hypothetical protein
MSVNLFVINNIVYEQEAMAASIKLRRDSNEEFRRAISLAKESGWTEDNVHLVSNKLWGLKQAFRDLDECFKGHYSHELEACSPIVNDIMLEALQINQQGILQQVEKIRLKLDSVTSRNIRNRCFEIYTEIGILFQLVEAHKGITESMFLLVRRLFEIQDTK